MTAACERIEAAIAAGERICVHGDYDADGICATALALSSCAASEPTSSSTSRAGSPRDTGWRSRRSSGWPATAFGLLVTVDCGITAVDAVARARELGMDVIVTDHHRPAEALPECIRGLHPPVELSVPGAVRHRRRVQAGAGAARARRPRSGRDGAPPRPRRARDRRRRRAASRREPRPRARRACAGCGARRSPACGRSWPWRASTARTPRPPIVGFRLAPRINAAGRLCHPDQALELLLTDRRRPRARAGRAARGAEPRAPGGRGRDPAPGRLAGRGGRRGVAGAAGLRAARSRVARGRDRHRRLTARRALRAAGRPHRRRRGGGEGVGAERGRLRPPRRPDGDCRAPHAVRRASRGRRAHDPSRSRSRRSPRRWPSTPARTSPTPTSAAGSASTPSSRRPRRRSSWPTSSTGSSRSASGTPAWCCSRRRPPCTPWSGSATGGTCAWRVELGGFRCGAVWFGHGGAARRAARRRPVRRRLPALAQRVERRRLRADARAGDRRRSSTGRRADAARERAPRPRPRRPSVEDARGGGVQIATVARLVAAGEPVLILVADASRRAAMLRGVLRAGAAGLRLGRARRVRDRRRRPGRVPVPPCRGPRPARPMRPAASFSPSSARGCTCTSCGAGRGRVRARGGRAARAAPRSAGRRLAGRPRRDAPSRCRPRPSSAAGPCSARSASSPGRSRRPASTSRRRRPTVPRASRSRDSYAYLRAQAGRRGTPTPLH